MFVQNPIRSETTVSSVPIPSNQLSNIVLTEYKLFHITGLSVKSVQILSGRDALKTVCPIYAVSGSFLYSARGCLWCRGRGTVPGTQGRAESGFSHTVFWYPKAILETELQDYLPIFIALVFTLIFLWNFKQISKCWGKVFVDIHLDKCSEHSSVLWVTPVVHFLPTSRWAICLHKGRFINTHAKMYWAE